MKACFWNDEKSMADFLELFRDEEDMRENYPETYQAYRNTRSLLLEGRSMLEIADVDAAGEVFDIEVVHVSYTDESKQYVRADLRAVAADPKGYCILAVSCPQLLQKGDGEGKLVTAAAGVDFTGNQEMASLTLPASCFAHTDGGPPEVEARLYMVDRLITPYVSRETLGRYGLGYSSEITVEKPARTHTNKQNTDINICYLYARGVADDLRDYYYGSDELKDGNLRIPNKGRIVVSGIHLGGIETVYLRVSNMEEKCFYHQGASAKLVDSHTICWEIPDNWGVSYRDVLNSLYSYVTYQLEITAESGKQRYTFVVTNDKGAKGSLNKKIIDPINIYKDCFEKGTGILMEDGSEKKVEELEEGDCVRTPDGTKKMILGVGSVGLETAVVHIRGENGREIYVSQDHPFVTDDGLVCARFLQEGDKITGDGGRVRIDEMCVTPRLKLTMYQVVTDNGGNGRLYANGFLTGDSAAELSEAEKVNNLKYRVPEAWRTDFESWMARME